MDDMVLPDFLGGGAVFAANDFAIESEVKLNCGKLNMDQWNPCNLGICICICLVSIICNSVL
jgi:hypothetical protein